MAISNFFIVFQYRAKRHRYLKSGLLRDTIGCELLSPNCFSESKKSWQVLLVCLWFHEFLTSSVFVSLEQQRKIVCHIYSTQTCNIHISTREFTLWTWLRMRLVTYHICSNNFIFHCMIKTILREHVPAYGVSCLPLNFSKISPKFARDYSSASQ